LVNVSDKSDKTTQKR